jgi:hypothetical protein
MENPRRAAWAALSLLLCCASPAVQADDGHNHLTAAEAFFDGPPPPAGGGTPLTLADGPGAVFAEAFRSVDAAGLELGRHAVSVRFQDAGGRWSAPLAQSFFLPAGADDGAAIGGANRIQGAEVFFDTDPGEGLGIALPTADDGAIDSSYEVLSTYALATGMEPGVHTVHVRFQDAAGVWSEPLVQSFLLLTGIDDGAAIGGANRIQAAEAFFDTDPGEGLGIALPTPDDGDIDSSYEVLSAHAVATGMDPGVHTVHVRFQDAAGVWSEPLVQSFFLPPGAGEGVAVGGTNHIAAAEAFFDVDPGEGEGYPLAAEDGAIDTSIETLLATLPAGSDLAPGIHTVYVRTQDAAGLWSVPLTQSFRLYAVGSGQGGPTVLVTAEYQVDDGPFQPAPAEDGVFGGVLETVALEVPVESGYHSAQVRFQDSAGNWSGEPSDAGGGGGLDGDWDGLPDDWELAHLGSLDLTGRDDPDGDGFSNSDEYRLGLDPLIPDLGGGVTVSGFVRDAAGAAVPDVTVCISGQVYADCGVRTDAVGHYAIGLSQVLPPGDYIVYPRASADAGPLRFDPPSRDVTVAAAHVSNVDFGAEVIPDTTAPETTLVDGPPEDGLIATDSASFTWSGHDDRDGVVSFSFRLDAGPWTEPNLATTTTLEHLADGEHTFEVRAVDQAGNPDPTPAARSFVVDATAPEPPGPLMASLTAQGVRLTWLPSASADVSSYQLYWDEGTGEVDYASALATIAHPGAAYVAPLPAPGTYRFAIRAADYAGNQETNRDRVADVALAPVTVTLAMAEQPYDRGETVPLGGSVRLGEAPLSGVPVTLDVQGSSLHRTYTAISDSEGAYTYPFQPYATEAGHYTATASARYGGFVATASADFFILGLHLTPAETHLDLSMASSQSVEWTLRNLGESPLTGLTFEVQDPEPGDGLSAAFGTGLPEGLDPGATATLPLTVTAASGTAPNQAADFTVRVTAAEGAEETARLSVFAHDAAPVPVVEPSPLVVGVRPGFAETRTVSITNRGFAPLTSGSVRLHDPEAHADWVSVVNGDFAALSPGETADVLVHVAPAEDEPLGRRRVRLDLQYDGESLPIFVDIEVVAAETGLVAAQVYDDTGQTVPEATFHLISTDFFVDSTPQGREEYNQVYTATTSPGGSVQLDDLPAGSYRYLVKAPGHDDAVGELDVEAGSEPTELRVVLTTRLVELDFQVIPTTIEDRYTVTLNVTYTTDLTKPTLLAEPTAVHLGMFPEDPPYQGEIQVTNTSDTTPVRNAFIDGRQADPVHGAVSVRFWDGSPEGSTTLSLGELGPGETRRVTFFADLAPGSNLESQYLGNIVVSGEYTFSIEGEAMESHTETPIPVYYSRPGDLRLPGLSFLLDERQDPGACDLEARFDDPEMPVVSNRNEGFDLTRTTLRTVTRGEASGQEPPPVVNDTVSWIGFFSSPYSLQARGDEMVFSVAGLEQAMESALCGDREDFLGRPHYLSFEGRWADRAEDDQYLVPVTVTRLAPRGDDTPRTRINICDWPFTDWACEPPRPCTDCPPDWQRPAIPTYSEHGQVRFQIEQSVRLERQAFDARLTLSPSSIALDELSVELTVVDDQGADASDDFFVISTDPARAGPISDTVSMAWQLVPSSEAGGEVSDGRTYFVAATVQFIANGEPAMLRTAEEAIHVLPMPHLSLDYALPRVLMAGIAAPLRVTVDNSGAGAARNLVVSSAQPEIRENLSNLLVDFALTGASPTSDRTDFADGVTQIDFGDLPGGDQASGFWDLVATRDGYVLDFSASVNHKDHLGVSIDPLITAATTSLVPAVGGRVEQGGVCPVHGLEVRLDQGGATVATTTVDSTGRYLLTDVPTGELTLEIGEAGGDPMVSRSVTVLEDQPTGILSDEVTVEHFFSLNVDFDGLADCWERHWFGDLDESSGGDPDGDGLENIEELSLGTDPTDWDTDGDGISDKDEVDHQLDPLDPGNQINQSTYVVCPPRSPGAENLVFVSHGMRSSNEAEWVQEMGARIYGRKPSDWDVCLFDWSRDAATFNPWTAYARAADHGRRLADDLAQEGYERIHFIAHSAGSNVVHNAIWSLRESDAQAEIHATFLDAYDPNGERSEYGDGADFAEQYVHMGQLPGTNNVLSQAFTFDVTALDPDGDDGHAWPYEWYIETIWREGERYGFPLALEAGRPALPSHEAIPGQETFPRSGSCGLTEANQVCREPDPEDAVTPVVPTLQSAFRDAEDFSSAQAEGRLRVSNTGRVDVMADGHGLRLSTGSPVWANLGLELDEGVNILALDYRFTENGEGLLSIYLDGQLVLWADERVAGQETQSEDSIPLGDVASGPHNLLFRLDPFRGLPSAVEVGSVRLGTETLVTAETGVPVAIPGEDRMSRLGGTVTLDGTQSYDPNGEALAFEWTQTAGPGVTLSGVASPTPSFIPPEIGQYVFRLIVSDADQESAPAEVTINVAMLGDLDQDDDIDRDDLNFVRDAMNSEALLTDDPRDIDGDGMIRGLDARRLVLLCTRPRCATE